MPESRAEQTYMQELDDWTTEVIIEPLLRAYQTYTSSANEMDRGVQRDWNQAVSDIRSAIRGRVVVHVSRVTQNRVYPQEIS
jgi:hypothetical protein